jgi:hypothetical protein
MGKMLAISDKRKGIVTKVFTYLLGSIIEWLETWHAYSASHDAMKRLEIKTSEMDQNGLGESRHYQLGQFSIKQKRLENFIPYKRSKDYKVSRHKSSSAFHSQLLKSK